MNKTKRPIRYFLESRYYSTGKGFYWLREGTYDTEENVVWMAQYKRLIGSKWRGKASETRISKVIEND